MNRFLLLFSLCFIFNFSVTAQQVFICMDVVASSGGTGKQANRYVAWTVGEPFIQTIQGSGYAFTQGFHQPDPCGKKFVGSSDLSDWGMSLFPNPTDGFITLRFSPEKKGHLLGSVFDMFGRPILANHVLSSPEGSSLDTSSWPPGVYFLLLKDPESQASTSLRVVRL